MEQLQERNILRDAPAVLHRGEQLSASLASRPAMEQLQERMIIKDPDEERSSLQAKRKRLEGFLADRPSLDQVQGSGILALPGSEGALDHRASSSGRM